MKNWTLFKRDNNNPKIKPIKEWEGDYINPLGNFNRVYLVGIFRDMLLIMIISGFLTFGVGVTITQWDEILYWAAMQISNIAINTGNTFNQIYGGLGAALYIIINLCLITLFFLGHAYPDNRTQAIFDTLVDLEDDIKQSIKHAYIEPKINIDPEDLETRLNDIKNSWRKWNGGK